MRAKTYAQLLVETMPEAIESEKRYREMGNRFGDLIGKGSARTGIETKLMRLLAVLLEDYDRRNGLPPDEAGPAERLKFLLEHSGKAAAELLPVFGQRSHVNEALNGRRKISAGQARRLGKMFGVGPGVFI